MNGNSKLPADAKWSQAATANLKHWIWFIGILAFEYWFAISIQDSGPERYVTFSPLVNWIGHSIPVIHNFDRVAKNPEALSFYFAITLLLMVPKAIFFCIWLYSSKTAMYRHFVVSPLTSSTPKTFAEFIDEPRRDSKEAPGRPRSLTSRMGWSLAIIVLGLAAAFFAIQFGWEVQKGRQGPRFQELAEIANNGPRLWLHWSLMWTTFTSLLLGITFCVLRDYLTFAKTKLFEGRSR